MWNSKLIYRNRKGFTLIELIVGICLLFIVIGAFYSTLIYSINISNIIDHKDEDILNARYGLDYIKKEILNGDKIICSSKIRDLDFLYPNNIGFVILKIERKTDKTKINYNYSTYFLKNEKLIRIAINTTQSSYPSASNLSGYNQLCSGITDISNTRFNSEEKIIYLNFTAGDDNFKSTVLIRCSIDN